QRSCPAFPKPLQWYLPEHALLLAKTKLGLVWLTNDTYVPVSFGVYSDADSGKYRQKKYLCNMNILIIGSGGRESAFAWKIAQSEQTKQLYIAPGNAGTGQYGQNVPIKVTDFDEIAAFVLDKQIDLVLVGPE